MPTSLALTTAQARALDADGWRLVVVLSGDLHRTPSHTLDRVIAAARAQGVTLRVRSEEWRRYFGPRD